jgi:nucleotide-binding universal stress UspA family protein
MVYNFDSGRPRKGRCAMHTMAMIHQTPNIFITEAAAQNNGAGGYARDFSDLIDGTLQRGEPDLEGGSFAGNESDLLLLESPRISLFQRFMMTFKPQLRPAALRIDNQTRSVLYLRSPRWPIKSILLVIRGRLEDEIAIAWMLRIAIASQARVMVLGIIPDIPALYNRYGFISTRFEDLIEVDSITGYQLRGLLKMMAKFGIDGEFHLVQTAPNQQILDIARATKSDLIIIAAESRGKLMRKWLGELVRPLLHQAEWPVLVASTFPGRGWGNPPNPP